MTTIACDGKSIAGDGLITGNGMVHTSDFVKVYRLKDGRVFGAAGEAYNYGQAHAFLNGEIDAIDFVEGFEAIILDANGKCQCMDGKGSFYDQPAPCVTGTGSSFALAAMKLGKTAKQAVELSSEMDTGTGGKVISIKPN